MEEQNEKLLKWTWKPLKHEEGSKAGRQRASLAEARPRAAGMQCPHTRGAGKEPGLQGAVQGALQGAMSIGKVPAHNSGAFSSRSGLLLFSQALPCRSQLQL